MRFVRPLSALTLVVALLAGCTPAADSEGTPAPAAGKGAKAKGRKAKAGGVPKNPMAAEKPASDVLRAAPKRFGELSSGTAPTLEAVSAKLTAPYTARAAEGALPGATVQILRDGAPVADVFPSADGAYIAKIYVTADGVSFPFSAKVGMRLGDHKNWDKMTCSSAPEPLTGKAFCHAFSDAHLGFVVGGWAGDAGVVPPREQLSDLKVIGMMWAPDPPTSGTVTGADPATAPVPSAPAPAPAE